MKKNIWHTNYRANSFDGWKSEAIAEAINNDANQLLSITNSGQDLSPSDRNALQRGIATVIHFISLGDTAIKIACGRYLHSAAIAICPKASTLEPYDAVSQLLSISGIKVSASIETKRISDKQAMFTAQIDSMLNGLFENQSVRLLGVRDPGEIEIVLQRHSEDFDKVFVNKGHLGNSFCFSTKVKISDPVAQYPCMLVFLNGDMLVSSKNDKLVLCQHL